MTPLPPSALREVWALPSGRHQQQTKAHMKTENTPSKTTIKPGETIELRTRFGGCSRGHSWGKFYPGKNRPSGDWQWVEKRNETLLIEGVGYYVVGSSDGFSRKAKGEFEITAE